MLFGEPVTRFELGGRYLNRTGFWFSFIYLNSFDLMLRIKDKLNDSYSFSLLESMTSAQITCSGSFRASSTFICVVKKWLATWWRNRAQRTDVPHCFFPCGYLTNREPIYVELGTQHCTVCGKKTCWVNELWLSSRENEGSIMNEAKDLFSSL